MNHSKQVVVTESTGKIHDLKDAKSWNENWKLVTGCNHTITDGRLMSLNKAQDENFDKCKNCFDVEEIETENGEKLTVKDEGEEVRLV